METIGSYLLQMACWLGGFWLVYYFFLRKETYYQLNRMFLLTGLVCSLIFPLIPVQYSVVRDLPVFGQEIEMKQSLTGQPSVSGFDVFFLIKVLYLAGISIAVFRFIFQTVKLFRMRSRGKIFSISGMKVYQLEKETAPFSFFRNVYVSKNMGEKTVLETVVAHEKVHIQQMHWVDLLLLELARALQWFNPLMQVYRKAMMENHEYLADLGAIGRGIERRSYQAILVNQMLGVPVIRLANSFTMFNPSKRIIMMKKDKSSPVKRLKLLLILPFMAIIVVGFARPKYVFNENEKLVVLMMESKENKDETLRIKGKVIDENGNPLPGTSVIISNSSIGTIADRDGKFELNNVKPTSEVNFSFVGFKTVRLKAEKKMKVKMEKQVYKINPSLEVVDYGAPPPPPPPPPFVMIKNMHEEGKKPLVVIDGKISDIDASQIDPETIGTINVIKGESATALFGDKGKDGVIEITTKAHSLSNPDEEVFIVVEDMPEFPGGQKALQEFLTKAVSGSKEKGSALAGFTVKPDGKLSGIKILQSSSASIEQAAMKIMKTMPDWKPGKQRGKAVSVEMEMEILF